MANENVNQNVNPFELRSWEKDVCDRNFDDYTTPIVQDSNGDIKFNNTKYRRGCKLETIPDVGRVKVSDGFAIKKRVGDEDKWAIKAFDKVVHAIFPDGRDKNVRHNNAEKILEEKKDYVISSQPFEEERLTAISSSTNETGVDNSVISNLINNGVVKIYDQNFNNLDDTQKSKWMVKDGQSYRPAIGYTLNDGQILYNKYRIFQIDDHSTRHNAPSYSFNESYIIDKYNLQGKLI